MPRRLATPGRKPSMTMSAFFTSFSTTSREGEDFRSRARLLLLRFPVLNCTGTYERPGSPRGGSTLITAAPRSAKIAVANGPGTNIEKSTTRTPRNGSQGSAAMLFEIRRRVDDQDLGALAGDDQQMHRVGGKEAGLARLHLELLAADLDVRGAFEQVAHLLDSLGRVRLHLARPDQKFCHRPAFARLAARRSRVFAVSTTKRACVPRPTSSTGSRTEKRNTIFLLSICSTLICIVTCSPSGVAARWSIETCVPTESSPASRCWRRKSRQVYSTSLTMLGVAYTMPSLPMKLMQRASSTVSVRFDARSFFSVGFMAQVSTSSRVSASFHQQHRNRRKIEHLARGRAQQRAGRRHAPVADVDQVAAGILGVLDDRLADRADENARGVLDAGGVELFLRRGQPRLALFLVIALQLALADRQAEARQLGNRQMHRQQLDLWVVAIPVGVVDQAVDSVERVLRAVHGKQDLHCVFSPVGGGNSSGWPIVTASRPQPSP